MIDKDDNIIQRKKKIIENLKKSEEIVNQHGHFQTDQFIGGYITGATVGYPITPDMRLEIIQEVRKITKKNNIIYNSKED